MRCRPEGIRSSPLGFALSVSSTSKNKDAAYLFIQWLNSKDTSIQRVQLPYALRDPFRDNHYTSRSICRAGRTPRTTSPR